MNKLKCWHDYVDEAGESHLEQVELDLEPLAPPPPGEQPPPLSPGVTAFFPAEKYRFLVDPAGRNPEHAFGGWHLAGKGLFVTLRGAWEMQTSDGATVHMGPGDFLLSDETRGKGHRSRRISDEEMVLLGVHLPD